MIKQIARVAATTVLGVGLTTGFAAADISNTGPSSHNSERSKVTNSAQITNNNRISASNENDQTASSVTQAYITILLAEVLLQVIRQTQTALVLQHQLITQVLTWLDGQLVQVTQVL